MFSVFKSLFFSFFFFFTRLRCFFLSRFISKKVLEKKLLSLEKYLILVAATVVGWLVVEMLGPLRI